MRGADALGDNFRKAGDPRTAKSAIGNWAVRACRGPHATLPSPMRMLGILWAGIRWVTAQ